MDGIDQIANAASSQIEQELNTFVDRSSTISHQMCEYALENILLHQAAAQQLQVNEHAPHPRDPAKVASIPGSASEGQL